jgi:alpha-tubulin suppressor-like RCC1 family protein
VQVKGPGGIGFLSGISAVTGGLGHTVVLKADGTVWAWGRNDFGQLGDGTITESHTPKQVSGLLGIVAIQAANYSTVALKGDGTVWAWGDNSYGQLGDDTTTARNTPVQVKGPGGVGFLSGVAAIAAGGYHSGALKGDGTVWAWGNNSFGELGDGTTTQRKTPVQVKGPGGSGVLSGVVAIGADWHSVAVKGDGTVWAWGYNNKGQLGDNTTTNRLTPVQVMGSGGSGFLSGVTAITAGGYHSIAMKGDGTAWAWGSNENGQLGDTTTTQRNTPVQVSGLSGVTAIAAGSYHSLALKGDGTVRAWGSNSSGELGDGTTTNRSAPVVVPYPLNLQ